jgi:hypothetical protein
MPVRAKDFSQSAVEGPRMFPSRNARPGQRVQLAPCAHCEQLDRSRRRMERTSFSWFGVSPDVDEALLPHDKGNCTQG